MHKASSLWFFSAFKKLCTCNVLPSFKKLLNVVFRHFNLFLSQCKRLQFKTQFSESYLILYLLLWGFNFSSNILVFSQQREGQTER